MGGLKVSRTYSGVTGRLVASALPAMGGLKERVSLLSAVRVGSARVASALPAMGGLS